MLIYIFIFIVAIYIVFMMYFKLKYQFWSRQPVFHFHNVLYWIFPPGIIQHSLPVLNKYYNSNILFDMYPNIDQNQKTDMFYLTKNHYLQEKQLDSLFI